MIDHGEICNAIGLPRSVGRQINTFKISLCKCKPSYIIRKPMMNNLVQTYVDGIDKVSGLPIRDGSMKERVLDAP